MQSMKRLKILRKKRRQKEKNKNTYEMQHSNEGTDRVLQVAFHFVPNSDFLFLNFFIIFIFFSTQRELDQTLTMSRVLSPVEM